VEMRVLKFWQWECGGAAMDIRLAESEEAANSNHYTWMK
jgi:hypothetical protein